MAIESDIGVLPGSPEWFVVEFETIGAYGAQITTAARRPISLDRGRKKGAVVDLESTVEFETDLTIDAYVRFAEGFVFAEFANKEFELRSGSGTLPPPVLGATDDFTIDAASALLAAKMTYAATGARTILWAKGYTNAINNGMHVLNLDVASTNVIASVATNLVTETPPTNASLCIAGVEIDNGDVTLTVTGGATATLVSAAHVTSWKTLGFFKGMFVHVGGVDTDGSVVNAFDGAGTDDIYGYCRITNDPTGNTLALDKLSPSIAAATSEVNSGILQILHGRFARNVQVTADADDNRYLERSYQFEASYPGLGTAGATEYEYAVGNFANEFAFNLPLVNKATVNFGFIGTNSDLITASRKTGASSAKIPLRTTAFSTSLDLVSITTDVVSQTSDVCFKSLTLTLLNNVSPEKCLGTLGAVFVNAGLFEANLEGQMAFTNKSIVNAIRSNTTVTFAAVLRNDDGAIAIDMPELTLGGGGREFPIDQTVLVNLTGNSFTSNSYGHDIGMTLFAVVPTSA